MNLVALLNLGQTDIDTALTPPRKPAAEKIERRDRTTNRVVFAHAARRKEKSKNAKPDQRAADLFRRARSGEAG